MYILVIFLFAYVFGNDDVYVGNTSKTIIYGKFDKIETCMADKITVDVFFSEKRNILRNLNIKNFENINEFDNKSIINFHTMCIEE